MDVPLDHLIKFADLCTKEYESWGGDDAWDVFRFEQQGVQLMVSHLIDGDEMFVVFRGTDDKHDVRLDVNIFTRRLVLPYDDMDDSPVRVHSGFITGWKRVRDEVIAYLMYKYDDTGISNFVFMGHSLGGALAQIASLDFQYHMNKIEASIHIDCITFGAPRVGNRHFQESRDARVPHTLNLVNDNDPVFYQPWKFLGYRRSGAVKQLGKPARIWRPSVLRVKSHYLRGYFSNLHTLIENATSDYKD